MKAWLISGRRMLRQALPLAILLTVVVALVRLLGLHYAIVPTSSQRPPGGPVPVPQMHFVDNAGKAETLAQFRGKIVLLNIWATWCVPCREEMPALDRLQAKLGGPDFEVVAVPVDRGGIPIVEQFYQTLGLSALRIHMDATGAAVSSIRGVGIPTTLLIDREGHEIGRRMGPAAWDSDEVISALRKRTLSRF